MKAARYNIDLAAYMNECELNYVRMQKLLPRDCDQRVYQLSKDTHQAQITFNVIQRCKYTTMVNITQETAYKHLPPLLFECRIYHDAHMLEVIKFQRGRAALASYTYPNEQMFHKDEKSQQQSFLSECLRYCLEHGYSADFVNQI